MTHQSCLSTTSDAPGWRQGDSLNYGEAAEAAMDKRKFLLNRGFERTQVPDDDDKEKDTSQVDDLT